MDNFNRIDQVFSHESFNIAIQIWNKADISLTDIRHNLILPEEPVLEYRLPANTFLFTSGGEAEVILDDTTYSVANFGLFHGGKGCELTIQARNGWIEYYMVLYKVAEPAFQKGKYMRMIEQVNPFRQQYGFAPINPIFFAEELRKMYEKWKGATPLNSFYGKAAFYRFIYEIYEELQQGSIRIFEPDVIAMAKHYMNKHYSEEISIQDMCNVLGISYSHFHRRFKQEMSKSPQEYLIQTRLMEAVKLLDESQASIHEIAYYCGFQDKRNLQRMFIKNIGITPQAYRENMAHKMRDGVIGNVISFPYNEKDQVSIDELKGKGVSSMFKQMGNKAVVAATLSLMLMLSACATTPTNTSGNETTSTSKVESQKAETQETKSVEEGTKTIHMDYGDVEIPANPQRVVVIFVQGDVMALGVTPVGTSFNDDAAFLDKAKDVTVIDAFAINEEEIMALNPDLILWSTQDASAYESLSKIAPTLAKDYFAMDYQDRLRFFGDVLNRSEQAEELIQAFDNKIADAKKQIADKGLSDKTVLCIQDRKEGIMSASWLGRGGPLVYDLLGFKAPEKLQEAMNDSQTAEKGSVELSYEVINEYASDYILRNGPLGGLENSDVWKSLPAVKENHIIEAPSNLFWFNDIISMNAQVDLILDSILGESASNE